MVKITPRNKWLQRYRMFFIFGIVILSCQVYLAGRFISQNWASRSQANNWLPVSSDEIEKYEESNSARRHIKLDSDDENSVDVQKMKSKNQKVNYTHSLRYEEIHFDLPCQITTKEAISAINRAKTQYCKQLISNITCLSLENRLYPEELVGGCPSEGYSTGKELGCFKDEKKFRLLSGYFGINKNGNSPKYCMKLCLQSGFPYAGVQYGYECFCGTDEPPLSSKIPDSSCNLKCPENQHETCGGYYTMNIYQTGIKKFTAQIANVEDSQGGRNPVKIVFLLTLTGRAVRQVRRLLKILYHRNHYYYIHIDIRQDYLFRELLPLEKLPNVRLTRKRFATIWGGASLLEMLRSCMWELLNKEDWKWDFVINLSESDFPVKPVSELTRFLTANRNRNFVKSHGREVQRFIQKQGLDKTFVECETRMWRIGDRVLPAGIQLDGGSDWVALSRPFVEYVAPPDPDHLVAGLLKIFRHTLLPAESFFHTALRNSQFCATYVDNNLHVTNWKRKLGCKCQYKHVVDWCGCSPNDFKVEDWPRIQNTQARQLYFARKFEPVVNQAVILRLELWLYGLEQPPRAVENLRSYWQSVYHHHDPRTTSDDAFLTLGESIKRRVNNSFLRTNSSCLLKLGDLLEVHSYHSNDTYESTLFAFKSSEGHKIEVALRPVSHLSVTRNSPLMGHLELLQVSSDYDQKEQMSRNFLRLLSPYSEPVLVYDFFSTGGSKVYNMTCLWVGPDGRLHDAVEFSIEESSLVGHVKPSLKHPILPGIWHIKLIYKDSLLASAKFLVLPLEYHLGNTIKDHQVPLVNGGSKTPKDFKGTYKKFLPTDAELDNLETSSSIQDRNRLREWIDELSSIFYKVSDMCAVSLNSVDVCGTILSSCVASNWSSYAPDPKSAMGVLNETTGTFNIW
ncbi:unnamed protein product [Phaedon cochleariae]|uniref:protein xylosyltransferase n=1 Tax=Phaedon cochleariae TaxID=80249 RepID=A0A9N9X2W4_PHACE|nr:unnamed protein product [Phaedon cochleariae]